MALKSAMKRSWRHLARERIKDAKPTIPLGKLSGPCRAWRLPRSKSCSPRRMSAGSRRCCARVTMTPASMSWTQPTGSRDAARSGACASPSCLGVGKKSNRSLCLMDVKEATKAAAPRYPGAKMQKDHATRVVAGARHLAPFLGERMLAVPLLGRSVFLRELLPQDLKLDIDGLTREEAMKVARHLAAVVGMAHGRQLDAAHRKSWRAELSRNRSKSIDAPSWLWSSVVALVASHEAAYLEHCRRFAAAA